MAKSPVNRGLGMRPFEPPARDLHGLLFKTANEQLRDQTYPILRSVGIHETIHHCGVRVASRASGVSWLTISQQLGIGVGTACRALQRRSKNPAVYDLASG